MAAPRRRLRRRRPRPLRRLPPACRACPQPWPQARCGAWLRLPPCQRGRRSPRRRCRGWWASCWRCRRCCCPHCLPRRDAPGRGPPRRACRGRPPSWRRASSWSARRPWRACRCCCRSCSPKSRENARPSGKCALAGGRVSSGCPPGRWKRQTSATASWTPPCRRPPRREVRPPLAGGGAARAGPEFERHRASVALLDLGVSRSRQTGSPGLPRLPRPHPWPRLPPQD